MLGKEVCHHEGDVLGDQLLVVFENIPARLDRIDRRSVRTWPADAFLFHFFDEARFCVTGWRLGEVLFGLEEFGEVHDLALFERREELVALVNIIFFFDMIFIAALLIETEISIEDDRLTGCSEGVIFRSDIDADSLEFRRRHLGRHRAVPDERVELELLMIEHAFERGGNTFELRWANRFVCLLRTLRLLFIDPRLGDHVLAPIVALDRAFGVLQRFLAQVGGIGTHVRDETGVARTLAQTDAFVELLRDHHRLFDREAELARTFLLERGSGERRWGIFLQFFFFN